MPDPPASPVAGGCAPVAGGCAPYEVSPQATACAGCRAHAWRVAALSGLIEHHRHDRDRLAALLALGEQDLEEALKARGRRQQALNPGEPAARVRRAPSCGQDDTVPILCRHQRAYPPRVIEALGRAPALHLSDREAVGGLLELPAVAVVGARACTAYGREVARALAGGLASAGVCVISGMALGIDASAHQGALEAGGPTLAVLPGGVDVPYPAAHRGLHHRLLTRGAVVSEMPPGTAPRRWCFIARNRIIAALAQVTVIVEARERSGALVTAAYAADFGREVAAVPGPVTRSGSDGTNALIREGAHLIRDVPDVLDLLYGVGVKPPQRNPAHVLDARLGVLLTLVRAGCDTPQRLANRGVPLHEALIGLTELELAGAVRRTLGGRYTPALNRA